MGNIKISSKEKIILIGLLEPLIDKCDFIIGLPTVDYDSKQVSKNNKNTYEILLKKLNSNGKI
jgi:hypothetical protein